MPVKKTILILFSFFFVFSTEFNISVSEAEEKNTTKKEDKLLINLVDVDIATVANFISKVTGKNFIYDDNFIGKVTIVAPKKIDAEEAFDLFSSVLKLKGFTYFYTGTAYKIVPLSEIKQGPFEVYSKDKEFRVNEAYMARLIPLVHLQGQEITPILQPLISKDGYITSFSKENNILVVDNALNIDKILNIINYLDDESGGYKLELVYLKNAQADTLVQILRQLKFSSRTKVPQDVSSPVADKRLNAIVLLGSIKENQEYKSIISAIDVPSPVISSKINVYNLENADSIEIAKVLDSLLKFPGAPQINSELSGKISITPFKDTNSLIIMASLEDYQNIVQVIKKLDQRPRQVFVEAMITEISINKTLELGAKWRATAMKDSNPVLIGGVGTIDTSTIQNILSGISGLTAGGLSNFISVPLTMADGTVTNLTVPGFAALFSLSEFKDVIDVLSTPHILTSDNKEAEIIVGENVPFLSKIEREGTTLNQPVLQSIERKDVGITLRIKPQISEGDYIKLEIYQEIASVSQMAQKASDIITTKRSAKTSVVVKDKQTIVIGGLIQDKEIKNIAKMPYLGDFPFIGWLFKSRSTSKQKTNLLVYLTPTIIKEFDKLDDLGDKKKREFDQSIKALDNKIELGVEPK